MSPPVPAPLNAKKDGAAARLLGSGTSGIAELLLFHPVDTVAKRLMNNKSKFTMASAPEIIFRKAAHEPVLKKFTSLFPGLGYAAAYKVLQRTYKFAGQPFVNDAMDSSPTVRKGFVNAFGERNGKAMMHAAAGSLVGIGEIVLLPADVLKIKLQTNPDSLKGRGVLSLVRDEGFGLYRGWEWTALRNAPGSFALFGGSAFTKGYIFGLEDYRKATWTQNFVSSIGGAVASITVSAPMDVIKTRIQAADFTDGKSGLTIVKNLLKEEGFRALFKGLIPKIAVVGPKLIFSFTLAQSLIPAFQTLFDNRSANKPA